MAALTNQIAAADVATALDAEFARNFEGEVNQLARILGIFRPERIAAGQAMYQYVVTGELSTKEVGEGDEVPLSHYEVDKEPIGEMGVRPFRKLTTAQAVLKGGYRNAVLRTDDKMAKDMRAVVLGEFFGFLANGTLRSQGATLQDALAHMDADLQDELEARNDSAERIVHFVSRQDVADYLGSAQITTQNAFGMTYVQDFLGVRDVFVTSRVPKGTVRATPVDNLRIYGCDFSELSQGGLSYLVGDSGLVGVHHQPAFDRTSCETYALLGVSMLAEVKNYIVAARIGKALADMTVDELKALAASESVDLAGKTAKDDILAALREAGVR